MVDYCNVRNWEMSMYFFFGVIVAIALIWGLRGQIEYYKEEIMLKRTVKDLLDRVSRLEQDRVSMDNGSAAELTPDS